MMPIDKTTLKKFLQLGGAQLTGKWVVIGSSVLQLLEKNARATLDIDLAGPSTADQSETIKLFTIAEKIGLPIEAINQAGAFFLYRIKGWESHLVEIHRGKSAIFYRPDATLFVLLKLGRFDDRDLEDCLNYLRVCFTKNELPNIARILLEIRSHEKGKSKEFKARTAKLKQFLSL